MASLHTVRTETPSRGQTGRAMSNAIRAEIGDLSSDGGESWYGDHDWKPAPDSLPDTPAILDLVEFVARHVAQPIQGHWHDYFSHHHLQLDRKAGIRKFVEDVNRLFSRNGLAYRLTDHGVIERTVPVPMGGFLKRTTFSTGDRDLDDLLEVAIDRFLLPKPDARQDAVEKLWDAFERLKTIEDPDKKAGATRLIDKAISQG